MRLAIALAAVFTISVIGSPSATAQSKKGWHVDERYGYRLKIPKGWTSIPMQMDESWMIAKFLSDKTQFYTEPSGGWTWEFKPEMHVIAFIDQELKSKIIKEDNKIRIHNPYKDYRDYLAKTYRGGGYHFSAEEEAEKDGLEITQYEIKVEKLSYQGPKRIVTWIFHAPQVDFAVQCEVLEDEFAKSKKTILRALKSFKLIPRTEAGLPTSTSGTGDVIIEDLDAKKKMTPEERRRERITENRKHHAKAKESVTPGWTVKKMGRFLVLNHTDDKYAKKVVEQAEAVMNFLDETFPYIGPDEFVREPILRICESREEERSFQKGMWWGWSTGPEIVIHKDMYGGVVSDNQAEVNRAIMRLWFHDRDYELSVAMPEWLEYGLGQAIGFIRAKGKKVEFKTDGWERDDMREAEREGRLTPPKTLMMMSTMEFHDRGFWTRRDEVAALARFLVDDSARKGKKFDPVLENYIKNLKAVISEKSKSEKDKVDTFAPKTEEEEDQMYKALQAKWKKREKNLLEEVFTRTFGHWSPDDWDKFEKIYQKNLY